MTASQQEGFAQYGADELLAVAEILGASAFPGVDERAVGTSDEARDASLRSARRSLLARGVLEIDDEGSSGSRRRTPYSSASRSPPPQS